MSTGLYGGVVELWGFQLSNVGIRPKCGVTPTYDQWQKLGEYLRWMDGALQWLIGDWVAYGDQHFGEKMAQAVDVTGWQVDTVKQYAWVAERVPAIRREPSLSFSHHREVADLDAKHQTSWLKKAATGDDGQPWSVQRLRAAINHEKAPATQSLWVLVSCSNERDRTQLIARMTAEGRSAKVS